MPTIYNILACGGLYLDLQDRNSSLFVSDLGNHLAAVSKELYPERVYQKVTIGYYGNGLPILVRDYPMEEILEYVWYEVWKFVVEKDVVAFDGRCTYTRAVKEKQNINRKQKEELNNEIQV